MTMKKLLSILLAVILTVSPAVVFAEVGSASQKLDGYAYSETNLALGTGDYVLDAEYAYTVILFEPSEIGKYTITVSNGLIAVVSYNGMWVTIEPSAETVTETTAYWECGSVGQSILLAVTSADASASISVEKEELIIVEIPWTKYENTVTPRPFTFAGDEDALLYVDTMDNVLDAAVLGKDGYYHLGSADGPLLYANLNDTLMSLSAAMSYGQMRYVVKEGDEIVAKIDYNEALAEYVACADSSLYPLTYDLILMFQNVGNYQGWYGEGGWVGGDLDDAWMFACYYLEEEETVYSPYDVDGNGIVEQADAEMLMSILVGNTETDVLYDFDSDGKLTIYDCVLLMQQIG